MLLVCFGLLNKSKARSSIFRVVVVVGGMFKVRKKGEGRQVSTAEDAAV